MSGSVDLNTNRGVVIILLCSGLVGGGASVLQNQVFGPGGEWQRVVTNQAVIQEQVGSFDKSLVKLTSVLENGFQKVAESSDKQNQKLDDINKQMDQYNFELHILKVRMDSLEEFRKDMKTQGPTQP